MRPEKDEREPQSGEIENLAFGTFGERALKENDRSGYRLEIIYLFYLCQLQYHFLGQTKYRLKAECKRTLDVLTQG